MNRRLAAYLFLERLIIEAVDDHDEAVDFLREASTPFWEGLTDRDRTLLRQRPGTTAREVNPSKIRLTARRQKSGAVSLRKALDRASKEVKKSPKWLREIYARNRKVEEKMRKERAR